MSEHLGDYNERGMLLGCAYKVREENVYLEDLEEDEYLCGLWGLVFFFTSVRVHKCQMYRNAYGYGKGVSLYVVHNVSTDPADSIFRVSRG